MMNNFTKDYIELAKDKRVQELRHKLQEGDWIVDGGFYQPRVMIANIEHTRKLYIWLPLSHQLDEEIIKILKYIIENNGTELLYRFEYTTNGREFLGEILYPDDFERVKSQSDLNPLICKLKLLLELL